MPTDIPGLLGTVAASAVGALVAGVIGWRVASRRLREERAVSGASEWYETTVRLLNVVSQLFTSKAEAEEETRMHLSVKDDGIPSLATRRLLMIQNQFAAVRVASRDGPRERS